MILNKSAVIRKRKTPRLRNPRLGGAEPGEVEESTGASPVAEAGDVEEPGAPNDPDTAPGDAYEAGGESVLPDGESAAPPSLHSPSETALLGALSGEERETYRTLTESDPYLALPPETQTEIQRALTLRPDALPHLVEFTSESEFTEAGADTQREFYDLFITAGLRVAGRAAASTALSPVRLSEPARLAVIFPGQRAHTGGGELNETMRRAHQLQSLFPRAEVDIVVYDPPERVEHGEVFERPYRATDYIHQQLSWEAPWDFENEPLIERDGFRFSYATASADRASPFSEQVDTTFMDLDDSTRFESVTGRAPTAGDGLYPFWTRPSDASLGAEVVRGADLVVSAGAAPGGPNGVTWSLDDRRSPRGRLNFSFAEADHTLQRRRGVGYRSIEVMTSLGGPRETLFSEHAAADISRMRALVEQFGPGQPEARGELLRELGLSREDAARIAETDIATAYAHNWEQGRWGTVFNWANAIATQSAASGDPFSVVAVLPGGRSYEQSFMADQAAFEAHGFPPDVELPDVSAGLVSVPLENGEIIFVPPQAQQRFRSVLAASTAPSLVTGSNSFADAIASGRPFFYETLYDQHGPKLENCASAAEAALHDAGYADADVSRFLAGFDPIEGRQGAGFGDPALMAEMFRAVSEATAVDDGERLRTLFLEEFSAGADPRLAALHDVVATGEFSALLEHESFRDWVEREVPAAHRRLSGELLVSAGYFDFTPPGGGVTNVGYSDFWSWNHYAVARPAHVLRARFAAANETNASLTDIELSWHGGARTVLGAGGRLYLWFDGAWRALSTPVTAGLDTLATVSWRASEEPFLTGVPLDETRSSCASSTSVTGKASACAHARRQCRRRAIRESPEALRIPVQTFINGIEARRCDSRADVHPGKDCVNGFEVPHIPCSANSDVPPGYFFELTFRGIDLHSSSANPRASAVAMSRS